MTRRESKDARTWGAILIGIGVILLFGKLDLIPGFEWWLMWPLVLIVIGVSKFREPEGVGTAFWLFGAAAYILIAETRALGLSYSTAWPVILILGGLGMLLESMWGDEEDAVERRPRE